MFRVEFECWINLDYCDVSEKHAVDVRTLNRVFIHKILSLIHLLLIIKPDFRGEATGDGSSEFLPVEEMHDEAKDFPFIYNRLWTIKALAWSSRTCGKWKIRFSFSFGGNGRRSRYKSTDQTNALLLSIRHPWTCSRYFSLHTKILFKCLTTVMFYTSKHTHRPIDFFYFYKIVRQSHCEIVAESPMQTKEKLLLRNSNHINKSRRKGKKRLWMHCKMYEITKKKKNYNHYRKKTNRCVSLFLQLLCHKLKKKKCFITICKQTCEHERKKNWKLWKMEKN